MGNICPKIFVANLFFLPKIFFYENLQNPFLQIFFVPRTIKVRKLRQAVVAVEAVVSLTQGQGYVKAQFCAFLGFEKDDITQMLEISRNVLGVNQKQSLFHV